MEIYLLAAQTISPQDSFPGKTVPEHLKIYHSHLKNILPEFKRYFPPLELRRMNTLIKSGLACALETLKEAGITKPDAIITGTGLGCVADTEKFLHSILESNEGLLTPTAFIQSTNNIIGALIALKQKCYGYNVLYAHKTASFDHALLDSILYLNRHESSNVLLGGFDEITDENLNLKRKVGIYKPESCSNKDLIKSNTAGSMAGEGTSFFLLSNTNNEKYFARVKSVSIYSRFNNIEDLSSWISKCIEKAGLAIDDIDLILTGINGDAENDLVYYKILKEKFIHSTQGYYKHLCGEFDAATAFGTWVAAQAVKNRHLPSHSIIINKNREIRNVILFNQNRMLENSLVILSSVRNYE